MFLELEEEKSPYRFCKKRTSLLASLMKQSKQHRVLELLSIGPSMFEAEAIGLDAMYETRTIRVPKPFKVGPLRNSGSYIIMEFIQYGASRSNEVAGRFIFVCGRKLAEMHKAWKSKKGFGFPVDNTIGSTPQRNTWCSDWIQFYGEHRLGYQLKLAHDQYGDSTIYQRVTFKLAAIDNGRKRKQPVQAKENIDSIKKGNSIASKMSTDDSTKSDGYKQNGSRRKNTLRRAAEAVVECK